MMSLAAIWMTDLTEGNDSADANIAKLEEQLQRGNPWAWPS